VIRKTTLTVFPGSEARALAIASDFRTKYQNNHRQPRGEAYRHGVIFVERSNRAKFYAYGWDGHVRVVESEMEAAE